MILMKVKMKIMFFQVRWAKIILRFQGQNSEINFLTEVSKVTLKLKKV